jgi:hypothetical protein
MAQFDVHRTTGRARRAAPYLVIVQSARYDRLPARVVIPLIPKPAAGNLDDNLAPAVRIEDSDVILAPWQIFAIPISALGLVVASLADDNTSIRIIRGIDELITRAYK